MHVFNVCIQELIDRLTLFCNPSKWLAIVSTSVLYNILFIVGRSVFWDMQNAYPLTWLILDYTSDLIYIADSLVHAHEGPIPLLLVSSVSTIASIE